MLLRCKDGTPLKTLKPNNRKKIIFTCDSCGKESERIYKNYICKDENLCRSCIAKIKVNGNPIVLEKNRQKQIERWENIDKIEIGQKISEKQKENWKNGRKGKPKKYTYNEVKKSFEEEKYILLTTKDEYENFNIKLKYKCPKGHIGYTDYIHWFIRNQRCGKCSKNFKLSYEQIKDSFEKEEYKLLSKNNINSHTKIKYKCPEGHTGTILWTNWIKGHRCSKCAGNQKIKIDEIKKFITSENYTLLSYQIKNSKEKFKIKCPEGHIFYTCWNYWKSGSRCPNCAYMNGSSKPEKEIQDFIKQIYSGKIINNDRSTIINPLTGYNLELDVYLPELNKAIEFNGTYWHKNEERKLYDNIKKEQCKSIGIDLLVIKEKNWKENKESCLNQIKYFL